MRRALYTLASARPNGLGYRYQFRYLQRQRHIGLRNLQISPDTTGTSHVLTTQGPQAPTETSPDAKFEVLGSSFPLLSVSLSASQTLYTARGTLVAIGGKADNVISKLSLLEPFRRVVLGIPFLYQRVSSTTPVTALISTKPFITSFAVVQLDGSTDWMIAGRGLLAWTGRTLRITPTLNRKMGLSNWGNSEITGRGLLAVSGRGSISQISLKSGENYIAHPSNVLGHSINSTPPLPYRLQTSSFRLQVPDLRFSRLIPEVQFFRTIRESIFWRLTAQGIYSLRTWLQRLIWGDRLFLKFEGPTTILLQTRAGRLSDVLTARDLDENADMPAALAQTLLTSNTDGSKAADSVRDENSGQNDKKKVSQTSSNAEEKGNSSSQKIDEPATVAAPKVKG